MKQDRGADRPLLLCVRAGPPLGGWVTSLATRFRTDMREITDARADTWVGHAADVVRSELCRLRPAVIVVSDFTGGAAADAITRMLSAGAEDLFDANDPRAAEDLGHCLSTVTHLLARGATLQEQGGMVGHSPAMRFARKQLARALDDTDVSVLILGETGTGKQLAARAIHTLDAKRAGHPFHALDCGSVLESLFGSELFGHVMGAFTGAQSSRSGAFASAGAGTLFIDEVGELRSQLQASFLSALQERKFRPVGSDREHPIRCRIVAATNRDLPALAAAEEFRADLFSRLDGLRVWMPPLRQRREDVELLFRHFLVRFGKPHADITDEVLTFLACAPLPGNVRQLEAIARHCAFASCGANRIRLAHLPAALLSERTGPNAAGSTEPVAQMVESGMCLDEILAECKGRAVSTALRIAAASHPLDRKTQLVGQAAQLLGVSPRTIYTKLSSADGRRGPKH